MKGTQGMSLEYTETGRVAAFSRFSLETVHFFDYQQALARSNS